MSLQSTDQIADLITRIRNAIQVNKNEVSAPTSKLKVAVVEGLKKGGYIEDYSIEKAHPRDILHVIINKENEIAKINEITKVSKPGRRIYTAAADIPTVKSGRGIILVSTSKGVMSGQEAKKLRLGGEILVKVW
ncbi:30S ribosomal protein S8 [Candidatus Saccharibacteria bacterium]|nr:30S ribosomal protein S8 [Candidatus Saccharibacteria bacterium]MBR0431906.1 30S ribosomal protein S8 [Candidatus Saccharibacteria bacterium]